MEAQLVELGWFLFKAVMCGAGALAIWTLKGHAKKQEDHSIAIAELQKTMEVQKAVQDARYDKWKEFGSPERRQP